MSHIKLNLCLMAGVLVQFSAIVDVAIVIHLGFQKKFAEMWAFLTLIGHTNKG